MSLKYGNKGLSENYLISLMKPWEMILIFLHILLLVISSLESTKEIILFLLKRFID